MEEGLIIKRPFPGDTSKHSTEAELIVFLNLCGFFWTVELRTWVFWLIFSEGYIWWEEMGGDLAFDKNIVHIVKRPRWFIKYTGVVYIGREINDYVIQSLLSRRTFRYLILVIIE